MNSIKYFLFLFPLLFVRIINAKNNEDCIKNIINISYDRKDDIDSLSLYYERGQYYFSLGQFENALEDFNYILKILYENGKTREPLFGAALWSRLFCHAYANYEENTYEDLEMIRFFFIGNIERCLSHAENVPTYYILPVTEFAYPDEVISSYECKERVRGTANLMRMIALKIPSRVLAGAVTYAISEIESYCSDCCNRTHWTECLGPIIDGWHYMKNCMDKGVQIAPKMISPGRY